MRDTNQQRRWPTADILRRARFVDDAGPIRFVDTEGPPATSLSKRTRWNATARSAADPSSISSGNGSATRSTISMPGPKVAVA